MTTFTRTLRGVRAQLAPIQRTARGYDWSRVRIALRAAVDNPGAKRIRVYSGAGFVPNSYRWPCRIQYIEIQRTPTGPQISVGWTGAQRPRGAGSLVVVQGGAK